MLTLDLAADPGSLRWATAQLVAHHYLHTTPDPRTRPLCYVVRCASERVGCLWFGRTESTSCYRGELTYGSQAAVARGRARFDRWELLNLSRVWLSPRVQAGGDLCRDGMIPGFGDRKGAWRPAAATAVIRLALARVGFDYLTAYPPVWVEQAYAVRVVLSYCDARRHRGTIYRAAGFRLARRNAEGIETHYTTGVAPLTAEQDARVRESAACSLRGAALRAAATRRAEPRLFGD